MPYIPSWERDTWEKGIAQGIEQGIEQGREEERVLTAKKMLDAGVGLETIAQCTGLSMKAILRLKNQSRTTH